MKIPHQTRRQFAGAVAALCVAAGPACRAGAASGYAQTVLAKRPVAYWRLGERSGPAASDASANGHDGTYRGNPTFGEPGAIANDPDGAVRLDGRHDYVEIPDSVHFSQPASGRGLTVEAWMRPDVLVFPGQTAQRYVHWLGKGNGAFVSTVKTRRRVRIASRRTSGTRLVAKVRVPTSRTSWSPAAGSTSSPASTRATVRIRMQVSAFTATASCAATRVAPEGRAMRATTSSRLTGPHRCAWARATLEASLPAHSMILPSIRAC